MRIYKLYIVPLLIVFSFAACVGDRPEKQEQCKAIPVRVDTVRLSTLSAQRAFVGTVIPIKSIRVTNPHQGILSAIHGMQGQYVEQGTLLAEVEAQNVRSMYEMTQAILRQAEDGYDRLMQVRNSSSVPEVKIVEVETQLAQARASAAAAAQALEECQIKAPFAGVVGEVMVENGSRLAPMQPILTLFDISSMEVKIAVPENEIGCIEIGDKAEVVVPALDDRQFIAHVVSKGVAASPLSHTYECRLQIKGDTKGLMPEMVSKVYMEKDAMRGLTVPAAVIKMDNIGKYVWLVVDGIVEKRYIEIGAFAGQGVVVTKGLTMDEVVITDGSQKVSSGMAVQVVE